MVTFIPPYLGEEVKSNAERKAFDILQRLNIEDAYVLHSLGLPKHQGKIYGEIDFVVVCKRGVACLEIKGGRVECRDGVWLFIDRYGVEHQKAEGPFAQVTGNMFSLLTELRERFPNNQRMRSLLVACGVMFPDIEFAGNSLEIIPEIVYDSRTQDITDYIESVFDYWENRHNRRTSSLSKNDVKDIVNLLRGDFTFIPTLRDRLDYVEENIVRLTSEQSKIMDALSTNQHILVEGGAGTGKTLLAVDFALKRARENNNKVLFLTFNKNLSHDINILTGKVENLKVINVHALYGDYVTVDVKRMSEDPQKYFGEELPEIFLDLVSGLPEADVDKIRYDVLVMDEGQDIIRPSNLFALDAILNGGLDGGKWAIFYDKKQNIYNPEFADGMDIVKEYPCVRFELFINCRNTIQIGNYIEKISGIKIKEFLKESGEEVQFISYSDMPDFKQKIRGLMKTLRSEKIDVTNVTFLGPKKYANSRLNEIGFKVNEYGDDFDSISMLPRYATIQGFKGLDSSIVVLVDIEEIREGNFAQYMYIAGTRARTLLCVVGSEDFWQEHK